MIMTFYYCLPPQISRSSAVSAFRVHSSYIAIFLKRWRKLPCERALFVNTRAGLMESRGAGIKTIRTNLRQKLINKPRLTGLPYFCAPRTLRDVVREFDASLTV